MVTVSGGRTVGKLKQTGIDTYWSLPNEGATNETGFTALPSGWRKGNSEDWSSGYFESSGGSTSLWTKNLAPTGGLYCYFMSYRSSGLDKGQEYYFKTSGYAIRCIKE